MRSVMRILALVMTYVICPGGLEVARDLVHVVAEGHALHDASPHDRDAHDDDEHRCSGAFHVCGCHVSPSFVAVRAASILQRTSITSDSSRMLARPAQRARNGVRAESFRPPIA